MEKRPLDAPGNGPVQIIQSLWAGHRHDRAAVGSDHYQSPCTLFLGLRNVCVERSAQLLFHAGHDRQRNIHAGSTARMMRAYNSGLRQYLSNGHYMETLAFHTIQGAMMIDSFGYKECPR